VFGAATFVVRDEAHNVVQRAQRLIASLGRRGEFEHAFHNEGGDHEFLNQFVRDPSIDHDADLDIFE
jgi:hypothetical protein